MYMRKLQVYHEVPVSYLDNSGLKAIGIRRAYTNNEVMPLNLFIRARLVAQETEESERVDTRRREQHVCGYAPTGESQVHARSMHYWQPASTCCSKKFFYDICRAHVHSPARRTFMIKVPREEDECKSGYAVLDKAMYGTKDATQCFDVASENAMTTMGYDTGTFPPGLYHSSAVDMSVFRHGDDFVVSGTRTQQKEFEEQLSKHIIVKHLATLGPCTAL